MRSVADALRDETRKRLATLPPEARIGLALALGDEDVERLRTSRNIDAASARAVIARGRRLGRRPSVAGRD